MAAASLTELNALMNDGPTADRCGVACVKTAYNVSNEDPGTTNHSLRLAWAKQTLIDPVSAKNRVLHFVLGGYVVAHSSDDIATIQAGLTDSVIQSYADASLAIFAA